jgi:hypothetical protein
LYEREFIGVLLCLTEIKVNYLKILIHNRMHSVKMKMVTEELQNRYGDYQPEAAFNSEVNKKSSWLGKP